MIQRAQSLVVRMFAYGEQFAGAERQILTLSSGLAQRGAKVSVHLRFDRELAAQLQSLGIRVTLAGARRRGAASAELTEAGANGSGVVLHAHNVRSSMLACSLGARARAAVIKTEHGHPFPPGAARHVWPKERCARVVETTMLRAAGARIIFVSRDLQASARWARTLPQEVIANGVEVPVSAGLRPVELPTGSFNVVFAGRLEPVKAPLAALNALALVPRTSRIHLTVLGDGQLRAEVEQAALGLGIAGRVNVLGHREDVLSFIAHADAIVIPSVHEGLPFAALEALALRTPLVASRVGGLMEWLTHEANALLVRAADPAEIADALLRLEQDRELAARLRAGGERLVRDCLSADAMVDAYVTAYERSIAAVKRSFR